MHLTASLIKIVEKIKNIFKKQGAEMSGGKVDYADQL